MSRSELKNPGILRPWRRLERVELILPEQLQKAGIRLVLLDRDNTTVPRDTKEPPESVLTWIDSLHTAGIQTVVVSNNNDRKGVKRSAEALHSRGVWFSCKPLPFTIWRVLKQEGVSAAETVIVGDQLMTDGLAGSLSGVRSILVVRRCETEPWFTSISRTIEKPFLRNVPIEGAE